MACLHITHDLADVADADHAVVLDAGRIVFEGTPAELFARPELLASCGLELPPAARLAAGAARLGAAISLAAISPEALVEAVWR